MLSAINGGEFMCITGAQGMGGPDDARRAIVGASTAGPAPELFWETPAAAAGQRRGGCREDSRTRLSHPFPFFSSTVLSSAHFNIHE